MNTSHAYLKPQNAFILIGLLSLAVFILIKRRKLFLSGEVLIFSLFWGYSAFVSSINSRVWSESFNGLIQIALAFIALVLVLQTQQLEKNKILLIAKWYIVIAVLQSIYGFVSFALLMTMGWDTGGLMHGQALFSITPRGTFFEANLFGEFNAVGLLLLISLMSKKVIRPSLITYLSGFALFFGLLMSWTRSAWIGFVLGLIALAVINKLISVKSLIRIAIILVVLMPGILYIQQLFDTSSGTSGLFTSKLTNLFSADSGTGAQRIDQFKFALNDVNSHHPILGNGYFSFKIFGDRAWISNMFILIYHDTGFIGVTLITILLLFVFVKAVSAIRRTPDQEYKALASGLLAGFLLYLFCFNFTPAHTLSMFWAHVGLLMVATVKCNQAAKD